MTLEETLADCRYEELPAVKKPYAALLQHASTMGDKRTVAQLTRPLEMIEKAIESTAFLISIEDFDDWLSNQTLERCELYVERTRHLEGGRIKKVRQYIAMASLIGIVK